MHSGTLYIISAPSGAGKTSLVKRLIAEMTQLSVSISHTTRAQRPAEVNGQDYFFVSIKQFQRLLGEHAFLEYAQVFDNFYGTAKQTVIDTLDKGLDVILEIDWQGARQVKQDFPESRSIFIFPPSVEVLRQRLTGRGQDEASVINRRLSDAVSEITHYAEFDYLVVNDDFEQALSELKSIIIANRLLKSRQQQQLQFLLDSLLSQ
ncbi:MAG: guanylate kinase [Methylococcaceae bacterium]